MSTALRMFGFSLIGSCIFQAFRHDLPGLGVLLIVAIICVIIGTATEVTR